MSPNFPELMYSFAAMYFFPERRCEPIWSTEPGFIAPSARFALTASRSMFAEYMSSAIGFSQYASHPASTAWTACCACWKSAVEMITASSPRRSFASYSATSLANASTSCPSFASISGFAFS